MQIGTQTKPVLTSLLSPQIMLRGMGSGQSVCEGCVAKGRLQKLSKAAEVELQTRWAEGECYAKLNATASKTTTSDRRTRGGGVIDTLAKANRLVLAAQ